MRREKGKTAMSVNQTAMSANKLIISLSAVLLVAGLTALPESAFAKRCTKDQRKPVPPCIRIWEDNLRLKYTVITGGKGFERGWRYQIVNECGRTIKIHEDIKGANDRGFKMEAGSEMERKAPIGWFARYRKIECCDVKTPGYHYTCGGRSE